MQDDLSRAPEADRLVELGDVVIAEEADDVDSAQLLEQPRRKPPANATPSMAGVHDDVFEVRAKTAVRHGTREPDEQVVLPRADRRTRFDDCLDIRARPFGPLACQVVEP